MNVLLIEDEPGLSDALCQALKSENYSPTPAYDGEAGLYEAESGIYDIIILDVMLPKMDGFEVLRTLRNEHISTPILMLTAKADLSSRIKGLDSGADYYLAKPFDTNELLACIRALTRRPETIVDNDPSYGDLTLKRSKGGIYCSTSDTFIKLGAKEFQLLDILMQNAGNIISKETLIEKIWGFESDAEYNNVEVYISFARKKIAFTKSKVTIKSSRGLGYSLVINE